MHVKGHAGDPYNELADQFAKMVSIADRCKRYDISNLVKSNFSAPSKPWALHGSAQASWAVLEFLPSCAHEQFPLSVDGSLFQINPKCSQWVLPSHVIAQGIDGYKGPDEVAKTKWSPLPGLSWFTLH